MSDEEVWIAAEDLDPSLLAMEPGREVRPAPFGVIPHVQNVEWIVYKPQFSAVCSVGQAPFYGTLQLCYRPGEYLLEFESFETWLRSISTQAHTIESFGRCVMDKFVEVVRPLYVEVTVKARTQVHGPVKVTLTGGLELVPPPTAEGEGEELIEGLLKDYQPNQ